MSVHTFSRKSVVDHVDKASVSFGGDSHRVTEGLHAIQEILRAEPDTLRGDVWKDKRLCIFLILKDPDNFERIAMKLI